MRNFDSLDAELTDFIEAGAPHPNELLKIYAEVEVISMQFGDFFDEDGMVAEFWDPVSNGPIIKLIMHQTDQTRGDVTYNRQIQVNRGLKSDLWQLHIDENDQTTTLIESFGYRGGERI